MTRRARAAGGNGALVAGQQAPGPGETGTRPARASRAGASRPEAGQPGSSRPPDGSGGQAVGRPLRRPGDPWRAALLGVLGLVIVIGAAWALLGSSLLVVRHVEVTARGQVPAAEVRAAAGIRPGTPLARLNGPAVTRRIERIAWVLSARVSRSWPDTVAITVQVRTPALAVADAGGFALVDVDGVVVRTVTSRPAGLPLLTSSPEPSTLRGSPAVRAAVLVLGDLPGSIRARVTSVTAADADRVTLRLKGRITVVWGGVGDTAAKARELRALMRTRARYYDVSSSQVAVTGR